MSDCSGNCASCGESCADRKQESLLAESNPNSHVKKVIAVVSGKGGVGKSTVTSMLAVAREKLGKKAAILDADITGPSIPKAFGLHEPIQAGEGGMIPAVTPEGIQVMSINLLLPDETDPVLWRGPILAGAVKQFWTDVCWGDVDYLFVDMPPGTGDVALTVFQSLPIDGILVVTSPQDLVQMIVGKAVKMARMMNVPSMALWRTTATSAAPTAARPTRSSARASSMRLPSPTPSPCWRGCPSTPRQPSSSTRASWPS